jgi:hypothetical protein
MFSVSLLIDKVPPEKVQFWQVTDSLTAKVDPDGMVMVQALQVDGNTADHCVVAAVEIV